MISARSLGMAILAATLMAACGGDDGGTPRPGCDSDDDCPAGSCGPDGRCTVRPDSGPACIDSDGDGHEAMACGGDDCDDSNSTQTGFEVCDSQDNDCDDNIDEGVMSACGG